MHTTFSVQALMTSGRDVFYGYIMRCKLVYFD